MKIEVGKFYKTRDGRKVRIYAMDAGGNYPVHGAILDSDGTWFMENWYGEGLFLKSHEEECHNDIVSEWDEPKTSLGDF